MIIGFGNGNFYQLYKHDDDRFNNNFLDLFSYNGKANAIELHVLNETQLNILLDIDQHVFDKFDYVSLHSPNIYKQGLFDKQLMDKIRLVSKKFNIQNIVYHPDTILNFEDFNNYTDLSISIENMDDRKDSFKSVDELRYIINKYNLNLTLDLQHCYVNDPTMKLANDFHKQLGDKIVEYHISAYKDNYPHHTLFQNNQDIIIKSLKQKDTPIIIESAFDSIGDHEKEINHIVNILT